MSAADQAVEAEIQAKGLTAPRVTPADIEANIASEHYFTADDGTLGALVDPMIRRGEAVTLADVPDSHAPLMLLTFCVLVTRNGHTVTGEAYCANPAKFNAETGRIEARKVAINKLWPMVVYAERERLAAGASAVAPALDFGDAIRALKAGHRVARAGWNGKGMWLSLSCDGTREVPAENFWSPHNAEHARQSGGAATVLPSITMKTATGEILMGWLASQSDMLATDWVVL